MRLNATCQARRGFALPFDQVNTLINPVHRQDERLIEQTSSYRPVCMFLAGPL